MMTENKAGAGCSPDYFAMADSILKIANDLRDRATRSGNLFQLEQAERLEQIAERIQAGAAQKTF